MKNSSFITLLTLFMLFLFSSNAYAYLSSEEATIKILQKNIEVSKKRMEEAVSKVYEAKEKIVSAEKWEAKNWTEVQTAMANYTEVSQSEISTIDFNLAQLLKINPSAYIDPFPYNTIDFTSEINQLKAANKNLRSKYDRTNSFEDQLTSGLNQVKKEIVSRTAEEALQTIGVPTKAEDNVENLFSTALDTFIKSAGTLYSMVKLPFGLYYYAKEMQAQVKSLKNSQEGLQWINNFRQKTSDAINMSDQGINMLQGWQDSAKKIKEAIKAVEEKSKSYTERGIQNAKEKADKAFEKQVSSYKYKVYSKRIWPAKALKQLPVSSYKGDALSIIQTISSAVDSAMNGGDPYNIMDVINTSGEKLWRERKEADKALQDAYDLYNQAYQQFIQETDRISLEYSQAKDALYARYRNKNWDDAFWYALTQIGNRYNAGYNQAVTALKPSARTVERKLQETYRLGAVASVVSNGVDSLRHKFSDYTNSTKTSFYKLSARYSEEFYTSTYPMYTFSNAITRLQNRYNTYKYTLQDIENRVNRVTSESELNSLHTGLIINANQLHSDKKELPKLLQEHHKAKSEIISLGQKYQQILSDALQKDNLLLTSENIANQMYFDTGNITSDNYPKWKPGNFNRDQYNTDILQQIAKDFLIPKNREIDKLASIDFNGLIQNIEELISKLTQWQDIISLYNARREVAYYLLEVVDHDNVLTKLNNSASYYGATRFLLQKEMNKGSWQSLNTKIKNNFGKIKKPVYWSNKLPREKLQWLQSTLYQNANKILRNYIPAHQHGGFAYATNASDFKGLEQSWRKLKPLLKQFDQVAAPMQQKLSKFSSNNFGNIITPATNTYNAIPNNIRSLVSSKQNSLMHSFNMLSIYFDLKRTNTFPLKSEDTKKLDEWITRYPVEMKQMKKREAKAQAEQERFLKLRLEDAKKTLQELTTVTASWIETLQNNTACSQLNSYKELFNIEITQKYAYASSLVGTSKSIEINIQTIESLLNRSCEKMGTEKITNFYNQFKEAYEAQDVFAVTSLLSEDWTSASDGASIEDLEEYLNNSFTVFDDITYEISNLTVNENPNGEYIANYTVTITGEIYDDDIRHEEKSSVSEILKITEGKVKIMRTNGGRFWSIK